ncbi:MAG: GDSL family lipase [Cellulosilyticum sp.]|nr:GDSL family lipase [Cellulosilyticum sp.]
MNYLVTEKYVKLLGRTTFKEGIRYLSYSCSGIEFEMTGCRADVVLWSDGKEWGEQFKAWMAVFINDEPAPRKRFCLREEERSYTLYESSKEETVKIRLVKYSEAAFAKVGIKLLKIQGEPPIPTAQKNLKIEFIGDSITCGYGNEGRLDIDQFTTAQENPYLAYAAQTALQLEADYQLVSWSGIGILSSWTEEGNQPNRREQLMPKLYPYTNLALKEIVGTSELWDFKQFSPDYIVIFLGTNDASYTKGYIEREAAFEAVYYQFLLMVRMFNPQAKIICVLGGMSDELYEVIENTVKSYRENEKDLMIDCFKFNLQLEADGIGTDSHPSIKTHKKMATVLVQKIQEDLKTTIY